MKEAEQAQVGDSGHPASLVEPQVAEQKVAATEKEGEAGPLALVAVGLFADGTTTLLRIEEGNEFEL